MSDISVAERLGWLRRNAKRWMVAIVILGTAALIGVTASLGIFSASSTNARNVVTAGSMSQSNTADNAAIMSATDMVPGHVVKGTATIENVGGASGDFSLSVTDVTDTPGPHGGVFSKRLKLKVFEVGRARPVYVGPLDRLRASLGTWAPGEERTYRFRIGFPSWGTAHDNPYQLSAVTATFVWDAVQTH